MKVTIAAFGGAWEAAFATLIAPVLGQMPRLVADPNAADAGLWRFQAGVSGPIADWRPGEKGARVCLTRMHSPPDSFARADHPLTGLIRHPVHRISDYMHALPAIASSQPEVFQRELTELPAYGPELLAVAQGVYPGGQVSPGDQAFIALLGRVILWDRMLAGLSCPVYRFEDLFRSPDGFAESAAALTAGLVRYDVAQMQTLSRSVPATFWAPTRRISARRRMEMWPAPWRTLFSRVAAMDTISSVYKNWDYALPNT